MVSRLTSSLNLRWIGAILVLVGCNTLALAAVPLTATSDQGNAVKQSLIQVGGRPLPVWISDGKSGPLIFKSTSREPVPPDRALYVGVSYLDRGYGKLRVRFITPDHPPVSPDRFLGLSRSNSGKIVTARMRIGGIPSGMSRDWSIGIELERDPGGTLAIQSVVLRDTPFDDPDFKLVISDPWLGPYHGPSVKPKDNTTLKGKVMAGYQGWFRTPNDLEGRGWSHWGNLEAGTFSVDMWPDTSQYPPAVLEKAAEVKLNSGKQAQLFSSTWPAVVDTHFRWMREHDIDGAFLQRFVSNRFHAISGGPEWMLANVRAAANREGRIWAVEYDVSGCPDAKLLETMKADWKWLVDAFRVLEDGNYAREAGKPVVFIWGLPFSNREISSATANAVVEFFRNDPKYGGNHVIGGIPSNWRTMDAAWQEHFRKYHSVLTWMPKSVANDLADFSKLGITYYPHVKPGFSWANLKHLPTGDDSISHEPREGGRFYWQQLSAVAQAGGDRLFVGMFDEYDEGTAIMPMSDDTPSTPVRPGVGATFSDGAGPQESGEFVLLPAAELELGAKSPTRRTTVDHYFASLGGRIVFPAAGAYTFSVEGAAGDDVELFLNGESVLRANRLKEPSAIAKQAVTVGKGGAMAFRLQCRHRTGKGTLRLLWEAPGLPRQAVPAGALHDAWGRFITNEGKPSDWWLKLTRMGKEMMLGKRRADSPMP